MVRHPPLAADWIDAEHRRFDMGPFCLESGETIRDAFVAYVLHGDPARLRDHAVLVLTAIGSTHHRLDFLIGEGAPLDTSRHCVVVVDALGNGLSVSPSNSKAQPGADFPRFTIRDMIESQRRLLDYLSVGRLAAVVGASMGGMQALQWAVSHPSRADRIVAMTPMARTARWSQLVNEACRRALFADAPCRTPRPREEAMRLWTPLAQMIMPGTPRALEAFATAEALRDWLARRAEELVEFGPDAFDWCHQSWAYDAHDVGTTPGFAGDTDRALQSIRADVLVAAPAQDLYNPEFAAREASASIPRVRFVELPGSDGHRCASGVPSAATEALRQEVRSFMNRRIDAPS